MRLARARGRVRGGVRARVKVTAGARELCGSLADELGVGDGDTLQLGRELLGEHLGLGLGLGLG